MIKKLIFLIGLISVSCVYAFSQDKAASGGLVLDSGTRIEGQLQNTVDVKRSKVGDQVVLKTTRSISQMGRTVVPKGSRLIGRITEVQQKKASAGGSRIAMIFDRLETAKLSAPINASIVSILDARASSVVDDTASGDVFASSTSSTRASSGGLLGGVANTAGGILGTTTQTVGGVADAAIRTSENTVAAAGSGLRGIRITQDVAGSAYSGTTLSSPNKNIRLEKGASVQLRLNSSVTAE